MSDEAAAYFERLVDFAKTDPAVAALALPGSRSIGLETPQSDYDCALFVREWAGEEVRARLGQPVRGVDLRIFTLRSFEAHAARGSDTAWDRYTWAIADFVVDRSGGALVSATLRREGFPPRWSTRTSTRRSTGT